MGEGDHILEWGWNAHAETYYATAKGGRRGARFLIDDGGGDGVGDGDVDGGGDGGGDGGRRWV